MNVLPVFVLFIILAGAFALAVWYLDVRRRQALQAWAVAHGLSFDEEHRAGVDANYPDFECLQRGSNRYAYNTVSGPWKDRALVGLDYHYETHSTDSKGNRQTNHHHFSAVVVESRVPLKPLVIRHEGLFDKVAGFFGFDDINFESAEFSRKFYVRSPDRKWAYDVIHPRTMELLLASPTFPIQFAPRAVMAHRDVTFKPIEFEQAADLVGGILARLPEYLQRQQLDATGAVASETRVGGSV